MKILALEKENPQATAADFTPLLRDEAASVWRLYQQGIIREIYFRQDQKCAVIILECCDIEQARQSLQQLPLVQAGLIDFDIIPLTAYPGFSRLFV
jgi:hypothetical protein